MYSSSVLLSKNLWLHFNQENCLNVAFFFFFKLTKPIIQEIEKSELIRIGRIPVQISLGAQLGLWTKPCYKVPGDLLVEYVKML